MERFDDNGNGLLEVEEFVSGQIKMMAESKEDEQKEAKKAAEAAARAEEAAARQRAKDAKLPFMTKVRKFFEKDDDDDSAGGGGGGGGGGGYPTLVPSLVPIPVYVDRPDNGPPGPPI